MMNNCTDHEDDVCMYILMYLCMYVCMYVLRYVYVTYICKHARMYVSIYSYLFITSTACSSISESDTLKPPF